MDIWTITNETSLTHFTVRRNGEIVYETDQLGEGGTVYGMGRCIEWVNLYKTPGDSLFIGVKFPTFNRG